MKNKKGFTLVEIVITIVIVTILSAIVAVVYRKYINQAKMAEGKELLQQIINQEEIYYAQNNEYFPKNNMSEFQPGNQAYLIRPYSNKYFKYFKITKNGDVVTIQVRDLDRKITMQAIISPTVAPAYSETIN